MKLVKLGDVAHINPTWDKAIQLDDPVSFVGMASMSDEAGRTIDEEIRTVSQVRKGFTPFRRDDLLVAKITPCFENGKIGRAAITNRLGAGSTEFHVVRPGKDLDGAYALHFLRHPSFRAAGELRMTGSGGQRRVPAAYVADTKIPLPPLDEQRRIAAILDKADELRTKRREALAHLDTLTRSIFHSMFGDPNRQEDRWARAQLAQLGRISTGKTPPARLGPDAFGGSIPFVTPGDLGKESVNRSLSDLGAQKAVLVAEGSLLVCCIGATIGKMGIAGKRSSFNQQINAVEWSDRIDPYFGFHAAQSLKREIITSSTSTTMPILNKTAFSLLMLPVPPLELQRTFATRVAGVERLKELHRKHLAELGALFASLQHRAFKGEL